MNNIKQQLTKANKLKPNDFVVSDLKWKYAVRSCLRGKNTLFVGPSGCGKTKFVRSVANATGRADKFFYINMGSTQDPRSTLIGNTGYKKDTGTIFNESYFVSAIQTENAVIMLDELSRCHPDGINILMTVLDEDQRYLRLDEKDEDRLVNVAKGVTFMATANVGREYTTTRVMDRALMDRFTVKIEMDFLSKSEEYDMLMKRYNIDDEKTLSKLDALCSISESIRLEYNSIDNKLENFISTRSMVDMTELLIDGFDLNEIAEMVVYPHFVDDDMDSERVYVKQIVQKYIGDDSHNNPINDPLNANTGNNNVPF